MRKSTVAKDLHLGNESWNQPLLPLLTHFCKYKRLSAVPVVVGDAARNRISVVEQETKTRYRLVDGNMMIPRNSIRKFWTLFLLYKQIEPHIAHGSSWELDKNELRA